MKTAGGSYSKLSIVILTLVALVALSNPMYAQEAPAITVGDVRVTGVADDWTHHRLIFSNPGTEEEAIRNGTHEKWLRITKDPRYIMQQLRRGSPAQGPAAGAVAARQSREAATAATQPTFTPVRRMPTIPTGIEKDWAETVGAGTTLRGNTYPAKWSFGTSTASCANDFVIYPTGVAGSSTAASVIAYYELYSGCTGSPTVDWAYNTGGTVSLSPVFSSNGNQVAFVQTSSSVASLVLLTFATPGTTGQGTLTAPKAPTSEITANYPGCSAPCMTSIPFSGSSPNDTWSNPFYDYTNDVLYVGDSLGKLHKFQPVFNGTSTTPAAEVTTSWPVQLKNAANDTTQTTGPVYDSTSGYVFVGTVGGYLYSVGSGYAGTTSGTVHGYTTQVGPKCSGINDAPLVDSAAGDIYLFVQDFLNSSHYYNAVLEYPIATFSGGSFAYTAGITAGEGDDYGGTCGTNRYFYAGAFDNTYFQSSEPPTGYLYLVGDTYGPSYLYQAPITAGAIGAGTVSVQLTTANPNGYGSPVTEFYNATSNTPSAAHATGTFSSTGPTAGQTISIQNNSNTLTLTGTSGTIGTGTVTVTGTGPNSGDILTIGSVTYQFESTGGTTTCTGYATEPCVWYGSTADNAAQAIYAAITNNSANCPTGVSGTWANTCFSYGKANSSVTAVYTGSTSAVVSLTNTTGSSLTFSRTSGAITLSPATGGIPATTGTNGCSNATTGTFIVSTTPATAAGDLNAAINACEASYSAVGVTSTVASAVVTVTDTTTGSAPTLTLGGTATTGPPSNFAWSAVTPGSNTSPEDLIFFSVYESSVTGCTNSAGNGCVISYNVTTPSAIALAGAPLNIAANSTTPTAPTGGFIIDNSVGSGTEAGASQIYFLTTDSAATTCTGTGSPSGICAVQASQTAP